MPENLWRNEVFHDRGDYQGQARADHHHAPGDHSPLEAGYIFADCFSSNPILLALGREHHFATGAVRATTWVYYSRIVMQFHPTDMLGGPYALLRGFNRCLRVCVLDCGSGGSAMWAGK